jgi:tetratricopeptide (TPR) repeat protein
MQRQYDDAVAAYKKALAVDPNSADAVNNLGFTREAQGRLAEAEACYARAIAINPSHAVALNNLGNLRKDLGDFEGARVRYEQAIAADARYMLPVFNRAELKVFTADDPDLAALASLAGQARDAENEIYVHFALGKACADIGDHDRAFECFVAGNALKRAQTRYDAPLAEARIAEISAAFTPEVFVGAPGTADAAPIFIVGMPRSGTTLIEQILASHPAVQAVGEVGAFEEALADVFGARDGLIDIGDAVRRIDAATLEKLGETYLGRLPALEAGKTRTVDKLPGNFQNIGFIRLALPNARIVHAVRDPIDTCVSCFTKLFRDGHEYTYNLAELGRFYNAYARLMAHWRAGLPQMTVLDLAYEDIVGDLDAAVRRLLAYCGLTFDARCLAFHETTRPIGTASAQQVRQPLYGSALGRARPYEAHLGPLREALR